MAKTRAPRRPLGKGRKRLSCGISAETHARLSAFAAHRGIKLGTAVEDAIKKHLQGFYVVDPADDGPQLGVVVASAGDGAS